MEQVPRSPMLKFGPYIVDLTTGEIRKNGFRIPLQEKPLRVLALLAQRQGQLVTREELKKHLWPEDTFVDFETGLNTAVSKLRDALSDSADKPRYIETIPRRGYRFLGSVMIHAPDGHANDSGSAPGSEIESPSVPDGSTPPVAPAAPIELRTPGEPFTYQQVKQIRSTHAASLRITVALAGLLLLFTIWWLTPLADPRITEFLPVTQTGRLDFLVRPASDGVRILYVERVGDHYDLMQIPVNGGEAQKLDAPFPNTLVWDVSPDGSQYLITSFLWRGEPAPLWLWPATGGSPLKVGDLVSGSATFSPDGKQIAYHLHHDLLVAHSDGTQVRKLTTLENDEPDSPVWAPDGRTIRFTRNDPGRDTSAIWEIAADGRNLHPVLPHWDGPPKQCCGTWTPDGRYFLFVEGSDVSARLYAIRESKNWWRRGPRGPFLLASQATGSWSPLVSRDGKFAYYYGISNKSDLQLFDLATRQFSSILNEKRPAMLSVSRDGQWVSYVNYPSGAVWMSHLDGSATRQFTLQGMLPAFPRLSPDNQRIALTGIKSGLPQNVYLVSSAGGTPQPLIEATIGMSDPDWSPDGSRLVVDRDLPQENQHPHPMLAIIEMGTLKIANIPASEDLHMPRWSPSGRYIAAVRGTHSEIQIFDLVSRNWATIARGKSLSFPVWSADGVNLYYQDVLAPGEPLYSVNISTGLQTLVASFEKAINAGIVRCALIDLSPNGAPIMVFDRNSADIYSGRLSLP